MALAIESIPFAIRRLAEDDVFKKAYGDLLRRYPKATFDKEMAFRIRTPSLSVSVTRSLKR